MKNYLEYYYDLLYRASFVRVIGEILSYIFPGHYSHFQNSLFMLLLEVFVLCPIILVLIDYLADYFSGKGKHCRKNK